VSVREYMIGDRVKVAHEKYPGVWVLRKINPTKAMLEPENGGRMLRVPYSLLLDPAEEAPALRMFHVGEFVRLTEARFAGLYVVIKDDGGDKVNVAKAGGEGGRYVRSLRALTFPVDAQEVLK
jgi:hypothetical protein